MQTAKDIRQFVFVIFYAKIVVLDVHAKSLSLSLTKILVIVTLVLVLTL